MLKLRIMGPTNEIKWFLKKMKRDKSLDLKDLSQFLSLDCSTRFKRVFVNVYRISKAEERYKNIKENAPKEHYEMIKIFPGRPDETISDTQNEEFETEKVTDN